MPNRIKRSAAGAARDPLSDWSAEAPRKPIDAALQARNLGMECNPPQARKVIVGIVTYNQSDLEIQQVMATARQALCSGLCDKLSGILVMDNGNATAHAGVSASQATYVPSRGNIGFGAAQNILMAEAFKNQADLYIAANPDGRFHPDAIGELVRMVTAHGDRALVEAMQFPDEHPKEYDPETLDTAWVSGACLAVPRKVYENIGGFDEAFFMYCEDVDLSWRARAAGYETKTCPRALYFHHVTNRSYDRARHQLFLASGLILARKWRNPAFEKMILLEMKAGNFEIPEVQAVPVPEDWTRVCDFAHRFSFCLTRW